MFEQLINYQRLSCFVIEKGILYKIENGNKLFIVPKSLKRFILSEYHNENGHMSRDRLLELLKKRFYWKSLRNYVEKWVTNCVQCIKFKAKQPLNHGLLNPIKSTSPFELVALDIVGPFRKSLNGNKYILVAVDAFTNWVEAGPLKTLTAEETSTLFFELIISRNGCPIRVLTDMGTQFVS